MEKIEIWFVNMWELIYRVRNLWVIRTAFDNNIVSCHHLLLLYVVVKCDGKSPTIIHTLYILFQNQVFNAFLNLQELVWCALDTRHFSEQMFFSKVNRCILLNSISWDRYPSFFALSLIYRKTFVWLLRTYK